MKLAEALIERANLQRRLDALYFCASRGEP